MTRKIIPIGIDDFEKIIRDGYYYVDKSLFIKELIDMKSEVNLFTRPRRFGKTLNMSMLRCFFDKNMKNPQELFKGLKIMDAGEDYLRHMGRYPVIFLSLKSLKQEDFELSYEQLKRTIKTEYDRHWTTVQESGRLSRSELERYQQIRDLKGERADYYIALKFLSECLYRSCGEKAIILIDEYDVPLENAYFNGFYDKMISLIRSLFESALKTNENLEFAVLTGCLRISKESIFTGLNNLEIISVLNSHYSEHFGFLQKEVDQILLDYQVADREEVVKKWYDGYQFGDTEVYNPWSVINYIKGAAHNPNHLPSPYWSNTSSNSIVRHLVERADMSVKQEIESLIEGKTIIKPIHEDITYEDIDSTQDNLWNFLFFTGYLKKIKEKQEQEIRYIEMGIPNSEVRYIYKTTVLRWFESKLDQKDLSDLYRYILDADVSMLEEKISENLMETISFYDYQENFYHGFLAGLLKNMSNYIVSSNRESGNGRPDIIIKYPSVRGKAVIMELKVSASYKDMEQKCKEALSQIEDQKYEQQLIDEGYDNIIKYGIAFYRKECKVLIG